MEIFAERILFFHTIIVVMRLLFRIVSGTTNVPGSIITVMEITENPRELVDFLSTIPVLSSASFSLRSHCTRAVSRRCSTGCSRSFYSGSRPVTLTAIKTSDQLNRECEFPMKLPQGRRTCEIKKKPQLAMWRFSLRTRRNW